MRTKLIEVLKKTIDDLKFNRKEYNWTDQDKCNCRLVAQNTLGDNKFFVPEGWSKGAMMCKLTGTSINEVFGALYSIGLSNDDIIHLENQSNVEILKEAGQSTRLYTLSTGSVVGENRSSKRHLIGYLEAWVRILEREKAPEPIVIPEIPAKEMEFTKFEVMKEVNKLIYQN